MQFIFFLFRNGIRALQGPHIFEIVSLIVKPCSAKDTVTVVAARFFLYILTILAGSAVRLRESVHLFFERHGAGRRFVRLMIASNIDGASTAVVCREGQANGRSSHGSESYCDSLEYNNIIRKSEGESVVMKNEIVFDFVTIRTESCSSTASRTFLRPEAIPIVVLGDFSILGPVQRTFPTIKSSKII